MRITHTHTRTRTGCSLLFSVVGARTRGTKGLDGGRGIWRRRAILRKGGGTAGSRKGKVLLSAAPSCSRVRMLPFQYPLAAAVAQASWSALGVCIPCSERDGIMHPMSQAAVARPRPLAACEPAYSWAWTWTRTYSWLFASSSWSVPTQ